MVSGLSINRKDRTPELLQPKWTFCYGEKNSELRGANSVTVRIGNYSMKLNRMARQKSLRSHERGYCFVFQPKYFRVLKKLPICFKIAVFFFYIKSLNLQLLKEQATCRFAHISDGQVVLLRR